MTKGIVRERECKQWGEKEWKRERKEEANRKKHTLPWLGLEPMGSISRAERSNHWTTAPCLTLIRWLLVLSMHAGKANKLLIEAALDDLDFQLILMSLSQSTYETNLLSTK